jgi:hypothetical protein
VSILTRLLARFFLAEICGFGDLDKTMGNIENKAVVATFPVAIYVLLISFCTLVLAPYADLVDVLA